MPGPKHFSSVNRRTDNTACNLFSIKNIISEKARCVNGRKLRQSNIFGHCAKTDDKRGGICYNNHKQVRKAHLAPPVHFLRSKKVCVITAIIKNQLADFCAAYAAHAALCAAIML